MSDLPPTPGVGASTPGAEPAPGAPTEPTTGPVASRAPGSGESADATPSGAEPVTAEPVTAESAAPAAGSAAEAARTNRRKVREGLVLSVAMDKTAVVGVVDRVRHPRYVKTVQRTKRLYAHDESNQLRVGDRVRVAETRPMSRLKRWRIVEVLERAK